MINQQKLNFMSATKVLLIICGCFISGVAFGQTPYLKPQCASDNTSSADFQVIESTKKINYIYSEIIAIDASFKAKLDRTWTINCELKTGRLSTAEIAAREVEVLNLKQEITNAVASFQN